MIKTLIHINCCNKKVMIHAGLLHWGIHIYFCSKKGDFDFESWCVMQHQGVQEKCHSNAESSRKREERIHFFSELGLIADLSLKA